MLSPSYAVYLSLFPLLNSPVMAAPVHTPEGIRCHCVTFYHNARPAACTLPGAQNLDWNTAQRLASVLDLDIEFSSRDAVTKVLQVARPPWTMNVNAFRELHPMEEAGLAGTKIVCGMGDEAGRRVWEDPKQRVNAKVQEQEARVSGVLAILVLCVILYAIGEFVWETYYASGGRSQARERQEKGLAATFEPSTTEDEHADGIKKSNSCCP